MRYLLPGPAGALLATLLSALPTHAFKISLDPTLCPIPAACTNQDYGGSTAQLEFKLTDTPKGVAIALEIANTTPSRLGSTLVGIAFDLPETLESFTYNRGQSAYGQLFRKAALPPFAGTFDFAVRSRNSTASSHEDERSFAGGNPVAGLLPGETTTIGWIVGVGEQDALALEDYMARAYLSHQLRAAARFEQVGPQGKGSDRVLGSFKPKQPPRHVPEPKFLLGLSAIALVMAQSVRSHPSPPKKPS